MHHKLIWNGDKNSGYIENQIYPEGLQITDPYMKPVIEGYDYESVNFDEETEVYTITIAGETSEITIEQEHEIIMACVTWVPITFADDVAQCKLNIEAIFNTRIAIVTENATPEEIASWDKQEAEARAWLADDTASTIMIDILLVQRDNGETKAELVDKIILKADTYLAAYATDLGTLQRGIKRAEAATTKADLDALAFWTEI